MTKMHHNRLDAEPRLDRYLRLQGEEPELFVNPVRGGYRILLDRDEIRHAERSVADALRQKGEPSERAQVGILYEDGYVRLLRDAVEFPDGELGVYMRIISQHGRSPGVAILPVCEERVVMIRHFRHATRSWHIEVPRGFGEPEQSTIQSARRELEEEVGAEILELASLGPMHTDTGLTPHVVELFYAKVRAIGEPDPHEAIGEISLVSTDELASLIESGEITDSFTIATYTRARLKGLI